MSDNALIQVERVSKKFILRNDRVNDLRERVRLLLRASSSRPYEFWALSDVSFSVGPGETLGIIGHNGSGKSTMLKLLTGIMKPTAGSVHIRGRVGALIEVGAGFHPDLTGRENIYLNGSILGLTRREVARKFDEIVAFAGLEQFVDTPVKRYSSGMYMRLGFAIAAHTDPDILLIDEVLAVGDELFQRKCLRHLKRFVERGGAVVFVSHALSQVRELCENCLWLDHGRERFFGPTDEAIRQYTDVVAEREEDDFKRQYPEEWAVREAERQAVLEAQRIAEEEQRRLEQTMQEEALRRQALQEARLADPERAVFTSCRLLDSAGREVSEVLASSPVYLEMGYRCPRRLPHPVFCVEFYRNDGMYMFATNTYLHRLPVHSLPLEGRLVMEVSNLALNEGSYYISLHIFPDCTGDDFYLRFPYEDRIERALEFHVNGGRFGGYGCTYLPISWHAGGVADTPRPPDVQEARA